MRVQNSDIQRLSDIISHKNNSLDDNEFSKLLKKNKLAGQKIGALSETKTGDLIELGALSKSNSSVAQLLLANPELKSKTWSIIHNAMNNNKPFQHIPVGTKIFYNITTGELKWSQASKPQTPATAQLTTPLPAENIALNHSGLTENPEPKSAIENKQKIYLGQLSHKNPTIANLLLKHDEFKSSRWQIIHSAINKNKAFTKIPDGSSVFIDAKTRELSWLTPTEKNNDFPVKFDNARSDNARLLAKKLDDAVKPFMGTPYEAIDCYTLVVHGLKNMGVRYIGQDSLSRQLLQRAKIEGRAENAYFTGEGITEAMGKKIYSKAIVQVQDVEKQSQHIYEEMKNLMKKGDILSFSLESRGHTGIISHNQQQWTYINSGRLDNSIVKNAPRHGVGEETLLKEISNWIKLAQQRRESLQITVGRLDNEKFV